MNDKPDLARTEARRGVHLISSEVASFQKFHRRRSGKGLPKAASVDHHVRKMMHMSCRPRSGSLADKPLHQWTVPEMTLLQIRKAARGRCGTQAGMHAEPWSFARIPGLVGAGKQRPGSHSHGCTDPSALSATTSTGGHSQAASGPELGLGVGARASCASQKQGAIKNSDACRQIGSPSK